MTSVTKSAAAARTRKHPGVRVWHAISRSFIQARLKYYHLRLKIAHSAEKRYAQNTRDLKANKQQEIKQRILELEQKRDAKLEKIEQKYQRKIDSGIARAFAAEKSRYFSKSDDLHMELAREERSLRDLEGELRSSQREHNKVLGELNHLSSLPDHTMSEGQYMALVNERYALNGRLMQARKSPDRRVSPSSYHDMQRRIAELDAQISRAQRSRENKQRLRKLHERMPPLRSRVNSLEGRVRTAANACNRLEREHAEQLRRDQTRWDKDEEDVLEDVTASVTAEYAREQQDEEDAVQEEYQAKIDQVPDDVQAIIDRMKHKWDTEKNRITGLEEKIDLLHEKVKHYAAS